jgi:DNA-directed RNA polymerase specialized sigma24 family protein
VIEVARFERHRVELTTLCRRMLGATEAEDAVQETFIRAWQGSGDQDESVRSLCDPSVALK